MGNGKLLVFVHFVSVRWMYDILSSDAGCTFWSRSHSTWLEVESLSEHSSRTFPSDPSQMSVPREITDSNNWLQPSTTGEDSKEQASVLQK